MFSNATTVTMIVLLAKVNVTKMRISPIFLLFGCMLTSLLISFNVDSNLFPCHTQTPMENNLDGIGQNYITCGWIGGVGLGNQMFQFATLLGLAQLLNLEPIIVASEHVMLEEVFDIKISRIAKQIDWTDIKEECVSCYTPMRYFNLSKNRSWRVWWRLTGYLQSYQYFQGIRGQIISQFQFKPERVLEATVRRAKIFDEICPSTTVSNCVLISVHIRRGDYLFSEHIESGRLVADESYILTAVQWYQHHFANFNRVFEVLGNDLDWNNRTFTRLINDSFVVLKPTSAAGDLCLLSLTDHSIMTVGTYWFWAAYLTGGNVTCLKNFTRNGSEFETVMRDQYWPPEWIGL